MAFIRMAWDRVSGSFMLAKCRSSFFSLEAVFAAVVDCLFYEVPLLLRRFLISSGWRRATGSGLGLLPLLALCFGVL